MLIDFDHQASRALLGAAGECYVTQQLEKKGFSICARNFKIRGGEIDIIAQRADLVIFVEVKTRSHLFFDLSQVITPTKQQSVIKAARSYIFSQRFTNKSYRFDVALVSKKADGSFENEYIANAFAPSETSAF
jgi:putative endonuclease